MAARGSPMTSGAAEPIGRMVLTWDLLCPETPFHPWDADWRI